MLQVLRHLESFSSGENIKRARQPLLAAALLHDVGHGPFSHLFEPCLGIDHEVWSRAVILDEQSNVNAVLRKEVIDICRSTVADLDRQGQQRKHPAWQKALLSSQLDVDRVDYLRRDSLFTGRLAMGNFDWFQLMTTIQSSMAMTRVDSTSSGPEKAGNVLH